MSTPSSPLPGPADPDLDPAEIRLNRHMRRALAKNPAALAAGGGPGRLLVSRRGFLGALAAGGALAAAGPVTAAAAAPRGGLKLAAPSFTEISAELEFGPPADVSAGWDGTLWGIDTSGAPQLYDPMTNTWASQDPGVDAVVALGVPGVIYHFRGDSYVTVTGGTNQVQGPPVKIAATWPNLPQSFATGVQGAANVNGDLYLFGGGLYVVASKSRPPPVPGKLTDLAGWPQTPVWKGGVIDAVSSDASGQSPKVQLYRGDEVLSVDMAKRQVLGPPQSLSSIAPWHGHVPADWLASGIGGGFYYTTSSGADTTLYRGTAMIFFKTADAGTAVPQYLPTVFHDWPTAWHPVLANAPGGRAGALSAAANDGTVVQNDGTAWAVLPAPGSGPALSVSAGRDGTVYAATAAAVHRLDGTAWAAGLTPGGQLAQVAVGDASQVWARDATGTVYQLNDAGSGFNRAMLLGSASYIAANADGTVWRCNDDPNTYRFISEGTLAPQTIPLGPGGTAVRKVASTGFGNSFCLADPPGVQSAQGGGSQLFAYQSDYQFKTSESYNAIGFGTISQGAGMVFLYVDESTAGQVASAIIGLDAHTGDQRFIWSDQGATLTNPVYDPGNQVLYVGTSTGVLYALNIATQQPLWSYPVPGGASIDAAPALAGANLCFGDSHGVLYMINTGRAAAAAPTAPKPVWTQAGPVGKVQTRVATPLINDGRAVFVTWATNSAPSTEITATTLSLTDGTEVYPAQPSYRVLAGASDFVPAPPVLGTMFVPDRSVPGNSSLAPAIFVNVYDRIVAIAGQSQDYPGLLVTYQLGGGAHFTSGMDFDQGSRVLWVGDVTGRLFGLTQTSVDQLLAPVANTPILPRPGDEVLTTPVVYTDAAGKTYVLFGTVGSASTELWIFDPGSPAGEANPVSVETGQTRVSQLSPSVSNGVVYAAGATFWQPAETAAGQVFSIYVDRAVQALRDFIVESQLMQDFDEPPAGTTTPPTFARYQTHLTVVDELKAPRSFESVKVWADRSTTVSINGAAPVSIGPGDDEFAAGQTGADGVITIATGSLADGDEADVFAAPLRVWAGFMDPYERVIIFPDREFHGRLAAAQAVTDPASPNYDNPDLVNLQTAHTYSGAPLFTSAEQNSGQPQNVAGAIKTMASAVPISAGGQAPGAPPPAGHKHHGGPPPLGAPPDKYLAYSNLPGGAFSPVNVAASQPAAPVATAGLKLASDDTGTTPPALAVLGHADATLAINALQGREWTPSGQLGAGLLGNIFSDFWHFIKKAAATITHVVISIGKEVYAGIRFIIGNVVWVFKHPLQFLEDVVSAVGSFFLQLGKLIKNVVEAIGILFHFDEIIKTHNFLRIELLNRVSGYADTITKQVIPAVNAFFGTAESKIGQALDNLKALVDAGKVPSTVSAQSGAGSTPASMFNVAPLDQSAPASSHSVACMWAVHKSAQVKPGQVFYLPRQPSVGPAEAAASSDPSTLEDFIQGFFKRLANDGDLHNDLENIKSDISGAFSAHSFTQFAEESLDALIDIVKLVLQGLIAVTNAFVDGLLGAFADFIEFLFGAKDANGNTTPGLLTQPIKIPILSALYQDAFHADLTFLDLAMLVSAIPVTILYRVLAGHYPSKDLPTTPAGLLGDVNREAVRNAFGILGCLGGLYCTAVGAVGDAYTALEVTATQGGVEFKVPADIYKVMNTLSLVSWIFVQGCAEPQTSIKSPMRQDWAFWGVGFAPILACGLAQYIEAKFPENELLGEVVWVIASWVGAALAYVLMVQGSWVWEAIKNPSDLDTVLWGANIVGNMPGAANPFIYTPYLGLIVPPLDVLCGLGSAAVQLVTTIQTWKQPFT
jgi:PQQ-like domain